MQGTARISSTRGLISPIDKQTTYSSGRSHSSVCSFIGAILRSKRAKDARGAGPGAAATAYDVDSPSWRCTFLDDLLWSWTLGSRSRGVGTRRTGTGIRDD